MMVSLADPTNKENCAKLIDDGINARRQIVLFVQAIQSTEAVEQIKYSAE